MWTECRSTNMSSQIMICWRSGSQRLMRNSGPEWPGDGADSLLFFPAPPPLHTFSCFLLQNNKSSSMRKNMIYYSGVGPVLLPDFNSRPSAVWRMRMSVQYICSASICCLIDKLDLFNQWNALRLQKDSDKDQPLLMTLEEEQGHCSWFLWSVRLHN